MEQSFLVGEAGGDFIREALSRSEPKRAILDFQQQNDLKDESCKPILPLLDLHGLTRAEVYSSVLKDLSDDLLKRVLTLDQKGLDLLLDKTFPYISFGELSAIPFAILKRHPNVPPLYLQRLSSVPELYNNCPIEVKRQIWHVDHKLFKDCVMPLLEEYIYDEKVTALSNEIIDNERLAPKKRREHKVIKELITYIGQSTKLYGIVLHFLRTLFAKTGNLNLCTLRAEILMALHDAEVIEVVDLDPCHKFAWCLDACIRSNSMEARRVKEITSYFDMIKSGEIALGDVAMVILDPYATHMLVANLYHSLLSLVDARALPSEDEAVRWMSQLVTLGLSARAMILEHKFRIPKVEKDFLNEFLSLLSCMIVDDRMMSQHLIAHPDPIHPDLLPFLEQFPLARKLFHFHVLTHLSPSPNLGILEHLLPFVSSLPPLVPDDYPFFQSFFSALLPLSEPISESAHFRKLLLDLLLTLAPLSPFFYLHLLRFFLDAGPRLPHSWLLEVLEGLSSLSLATLVTMATKKELKQLAEASQALGAKPLLRLSPKNAPFLFDLIDSLLSEAAAKPEKPEPSQ